MADRKMRSLQSFLEDYLNENNNYLPHSYSGRGMMGRTCLAITVDEPMEALQEIAFEAGAHSANAHRSEDEIRMPKVVRWDNMGLQYVVYWPEEPYVDNWDNKQEHYETYS